MVMKPLRPCNKVGCKNITDKAYCNDHKYIPLKRNKENKRKYDRYYDLYKRDQTSRIFYSSADWQKTREARKAKDNGLCQHCLKENKIVYADMVDHKIPIKVSWHLRLYMDNLQSLCNSCHAKKTNEDRLKYGKLLGG